MRITRKDAENFGIGFINYLKENNEVRTYAKVELKEKYLEYKIKAFVPKKPGTPFSTIIYALKIVRLIKVEAGYIKFPGTYDWSPKKNRFKLPRANVSAAIIHERNYIRQYLKKSANKSRDTLLAAPATVSIVCNPPEHEHFTGYYSCEVDDGTQSKKFIIVLRNTGTETIFLKSCVMLRDCSEIVLSDGDQATSQSKPQPVDILPGANHEIEVTCSIPNGQIGSCCADAFFRFEISGEECLVLRYLQCKRSDANVDFLKQNSEPYREKKLVAEEEMPVLTGEPLQISDEVVNNLEYNRPLKPYHVPKNIKHMNSLYAFTKGRSEAAKALQDDLDPKNYCQRFKLLLYLEEMQAEKDIRTYDMKCITLGNPINRRRYPLKVPGLAERRPSVLRGDRIYLRKLDSNGNPFEKLEYEGTVQEVRLDDVVLGFHDRFASTYIEGMKFNVRFTFNRLPTKLQQRAVEGLKDKKYRHVLFPEVVHDDTSDVSHVQLKMFNKQIERNLQQTLAVKNIVHGTSKLPYIVYGPPGTGKTVTIVEAIKQVIHCRPKSHILICAPSNSACDLLVERILEHVDEGRVFRMHAMSRNWKDVPTKIQKVSNYDSDAREYFYPSIEDLRQYSILATTLVSSGRLSSACFPKKHFDYVFVDEAGHAVEPECLIAVENVLGENGRLVLAGDPHQLGPVLRCKIAIDHGLAVSFLERLMMKQQVYHRSEDPDNPYDNRIVTKLLNNYRSHEDIIQISNDCFYDGELEICADEMLRKSMCAWEHLPTQDFPIIFHGVRGEDKREGNSPSYFNAEEASIVCSYVDKLLDTRRNRVKASQIGVISPYRKQVQKLRLLLRRKHPVPSKDIKVGSVEEFQGQERKVIIVTTVRSDSQHLLDDAKFQLGFLDNPKRFNVALTRAQSLLIVVGNPNVLCRDVHWRKLLQFCLDNRGYTGLSFQLPDDSKSSSSDDDDSEVDDLATKLEEVKIDGISQVQGEIDPQWRQEP